MTENRPSVQQRGIDKVSRVPVKFPMTDRAERLPKPNWIRAQFPGTPEVARLKKILRQNQLHTVCEEARCPNIGECWSGEQANCFAAGAE